jgi:quercetin dioxygenase-like cupin family protein
MLKVGPKENGSEHLVAITEDLAPGASIVKHRHLGQDEIILIQTGTAQVRVGDLERTVHAGSLVFLPSNTYIEARNVGSEPVSLVAIFSAPGFDEHLRCASVPAGQKPTTISREELAQCAHAGHAEFAILGPPR